MKSLSEMSLRELVAYNTDLTCERLEAKAAGDHARRARIKERQLEVNVWITKRDQERAATIQPILRIEPQSIKE